MTRWEDIRPILVTAYGLMDQMPHGRTTGAEIAAALAIEDDDDMRLWWKLRTLHEDCYIKCDFDAYGALPDMVEGTAKGRQEVLGWPGPRTSTANTELLIELLRAHENAPDTPPEQKTKVRAILDAIGKGGSDALSKVIAELVLRAGGHIT